MYGQDQACYSRSSLLPAVVLLDAGIVPTTIRSATNAEAADPDRTRQRGRQYMVPR